ncbi:hypothetical protein TNIN_177031 [Trichonephila inaurata madagascariensis]|uniref:Uncharacterized protein n=1 Tax=Trichonephila inaurata madagascariensis TaxID=2747483 RepID=A0A8X7CNW2_9ARAC|nr:hypothetical protein TNIN_177031 [Trichonephila inaurata madagascariensis]
MRLTKSSPISCAVAAIIPAEVSYILIFLSLQRGYIRLTQPFQMEIISKSPPPLNTKFVNWRDKSICRSLCRLDSNLAPDLASPKLWRVFKLICVWKLCKPAENGNLTWIDFFNHFSDSGQF